MKSIITLLFSILICNSSVVYSQTYKEEAKKFQDTINAEFKDPEESPLPEEDVSSFKCLPFFKAKAKNRITATFKRTANQLPFEMKTTTDRLPTYEKYGEVTFVMNGEKQQLSIYQNHKLRETEEYKNYLFLPFTDLTNGNKSYGGGRFIDLTIPEGNEIIIDFNKAYNPYCAYNHKYSCPIPPSENHLDIKVKGGVKAPVKH